jgi:hypothetical protein
MGHLSDMPVKILLDSHNMKNLNATLRGSPFYFRLTGGSVIGIGHRTKEIFEGDLV